MRISIICSHLTENEKRGLLFGIASYRELGERFRLGVEMSMNGIWYRVVAHQYNGVLGQGQQFIIWMEKVQEEEPDGLTGEF